MVINDIGDVFIMVLYHIAVGVVLVIVAGVVAVFKTVVVVRQIYDFFGEFI
jgi:hypothetical protein